MAVFQPGDVKLDVQGFRPAQYKAGPDMKLKLSRAMAAAAAVVLAALGTAAQARDNVYWSVGIDAAPGVSVGVGNYRPAYPVYVQPAPIYVAPAPVYVPRPVYYAPPPVYYAPAPVYYGSYYRHPGKHKGWHKKHNHHRRHHH
jgi:hypothetical protein